MIGIEGGEAYAMLEKGHEAASGMITGVVATGSMVVRKILVCNAEESLVFCRQATTFFSFCSLKASSEQQLWTTRCGVITSS